MRLKRQEDLDGCEWWDKICQENALKNSLSTQPSAETLQSTTPTTQSIDGTVVQHESARNMIISLFELMNSKKLHTLNSIFLKLHLNRSQWSFGESIMRVRAILPVSRWRHQQRRQ